MIANDTLLDLIQAVKVCNARSFTVKHSGVEQSHPMNLNSIMLFQHCLINVIKFK